MPKELPARELDRRKFWKFVCREGLYLPSVKLVEKLIYKCEKRDYVLCNANHEKYPIFQNTDQKLNGWPALLTTGYFRIPTAKNPYCETTSQYGIAQYSHCGIHYKKFSKLRNDNEAKGLKIARIKKASIEIKDLQKKSSMKWRLIRQVRFVDFLHEELKRMNFHTYSISPRNAWPLVEELRGAIYTLHITKFTELFESLMDGVYQIQINNIFYLIKRLKTSTQLPCHNQKTPSSALPPSPTTKARSSSSPPKARKC